MMELSSMKRLYLYLEKNSDVSTDIKIRNWLQAVSSNIYHYLNREILIQSRTEYIDAIYKKNEYFLNAYPISSITSIKADVTGEFSGSEYTLTTDQYRLGKNSDSVIIDNEYNSFEKSIQVIYTGGLAYHATQSVFGINTVVGSMTVGKYVKGGTSESWGCIKAISATSITIEVLAGYFELNETITEYATLTGSASSNTAKLASVTSRCLAEEYPDIVAACELQVRFMDQHKLDFENSGTNKDGTSIRRGSDKPFGLEPEVRMMLDSYVRL